MHSVLVSGGRSHAALRLLVILGLFVCASAFASAGSWWNSGWRFRVPVTVDPAGYERADKPAEVHLNFTSLLSGLSQTGGFDENSLRVVEVDNAGNVLNANVAFQFDKDPSYDLSANASGTVIFIMDGTTAAGSQRFYHVYFETTGGSISPVSVPAQVAITDDVMDAGQLSFQVNANGSTYYYHKQGAGFSSWVDADGHDWLSFDPAPGSGSAGEYRGIPNAVYPEGHFHPGKTSSTSDIVSTGPVKIKIHSATTDGKWECTWEFYPHYATMTMTRMDHPYWLLYEGTPGGLLEPDVDFMTRSDGTQTTLRASWTGDIATNEWAYFSDPNDGTEGRSLFMAHTEDDSFTDSYYDMQDNMTVFGFGRDGINTYINSVPQHLTIGLMDGTTFAQSSKTIFSAYKPLTVTASAAERVSLFGPLLVSPANNALYQSITPVLQWHATALAASYHVQVSTDSLFGSTVVNDSLLADTAHAVSGLSGLTKYFWRVRGKNVNGIGPWSAVWKFTTTLPPPALKYPANGSANVPSTLALQWGRVAGATTYRLQFSDEPSFTTGLMINDSTLTDTAKTVSGLASNRTYYWRVGAKGGGLSSALSATWSFSTSLPAPMLVAPANGSAGVPRTIALQWTLVPAAVAYLVQAGTDSTFAGGMIVNDSLAVDTVKALSGLAGQTKYYWRVASRNTNGFSAFTPKWSFTTALPAPAQIAPGNNATAQPTTLTFVWHMMSGATHYHFQLATDQTFTSGFIKNDSSLTDTTRFVVGLTKNVHYYWRVAGKVGGVAGEFSPAWTFVTESDLPESVSLISPANGTQVPNGSVTFQWYSSQPGVTRYMFELSPDSLFTFRMIDSTLTDTVKTVAQLPAGGAIWWRVRAGNAGGWGPYSQVRRLSVIDGITARDEAPTTYALEQNYPNPFNPSTLISYALPRETHVRIDVFSILGERVATLVNERRPAGRYTVRFGTGEAGVTSTALASGLYFYRLSTDDVTLTKKMLFVK